MKIKGLKKAVGEYQRVNSGGYYSPHYGHLMYDPSDGTLWTDEFYSLGHNEWKVYHDSNIRNIGECVEEKYGKVTMANVRAFI